MIPDFTLDGVVFRSVWVAPLDAPNAGHYERRSDCGRIVARRTSGSQQHEVRVDGTLVGTQFNSMRAALAHGLTAIGRPLPMVASRVPQTRTLPELRRAAR